MNLKINKYITITFQIEGIHRWEQCNIDSVYYLKNDHRHVFHFEIHKIVDHNNRDIEFINLKNQIIQSFGKQPVLFNNKSCEDIAEELLFKFNLDFVKVTEDNENGAIVKK